MAGPARVVFTSVADGDLAAQRPGAALDDRRRAVADLPWTWLSQVHGAGVAVVSRPGGRAGAEADAAVTAVGGAALAVQTADCAPLALVADGVVGVAHVGWRGLVDGVVQATVTAMRGLGAAAIRAELGPCIRARCYEFGADELEWVVQRVGPGAKAVTAGGTPGLDLSGAIAEVLAAAGIDDVADNGVCTACSPRHWSYRARGDTARQGLVAWLEP